MLLMLLYWATCQLTCWGLRWSHGVWQSVQSFAGNTTGTPLNDRMLFMVRQFFLIQYFIWALCTMHTVSVILKQILLVGSILSGWNQRITLKLADWQIMTWLGLDLLWKSLLTGKHNGVYCAHCQVGSPQNFRFITKISFWFCGNWLVALFPHAVPLWFSQTLVC